MDHYKLKKQMFVIWVLAVFAFLLFILGAINSYHRFYIKQQLIKDTTTAVQKCLDDTYHSNSITVDRDYDGKKLSEQTLKDIPVESCQKIANIMLSISK